MFPTPVQRTAPSSTSSIPNLTATIDLQGLELFHTYTTATYSTIASFPATKNFWRVTVPRLALESEVLMKQIFAVAALHLGHHRPERRDYYITMAHNYNQMASVEVAGLFKKATEKESISLIVFHLLAVLIGLAIPKRSTCGEIPITDENLYEWMSMIQKTKRLKDGFHGMLSDTPLAPVIQFCKDRWALQNPLEVTGVWTDDLLSDLQLRITASEKDGKRLCIYNEMIDSLRSAMAYSAYWESTDAFTWAYRGSEGFMPLLQEPTQEALVVFAHMTIMTSKLESQWWMQGWTSRILADCTEERPECRACLRREIHCQYPAPAQDTALVASVSLPKADPIRSSTIPPPASAPSPAATAISMTSASPCASTSVPTEHSISVPPSSLSSSAGFGMKDLALLHHWTVSTCLEVFDDPRISAVWQVTFPQIGFQYPFVAHAILSLAALHLATIDTSKASSYTMEATDHHNEALKGFQQAVCHISEENSEALLVWSILNMHYVLGISRPHNDDFGANASLSSYKDRMLGMEWIPMARGVHAVLGPTHNFLRFGRMKSLMSVGNWFELDPNSPGSRLSPVDGYFCRTRDCWKSGNDAEMYEETLSTLRKCLLYVDQFSDMDEATLAEWGCNRAWAGPFMFIYFAPEQYFTLLHQRQPAALILYAFFGALLHGLDRYWFLRGWGRGIVEVVDELLGSYWRPWISWPLQVVEQG
ncbi:Sterol uptake control protein [Paramyrothecium foliicola]|nr:Sterol uptake control protein [Paramyrothecium foliicola]